MGLQPSSSLPLARVLLLLLRALAPALLSELPLGDSTRLNVERLNVQTVTCLPAGHPLAPNQIWGPRAGTVAHPALGAAAAAELDTPLANVSCPRTEQRQCYSGSDLLPTGRANMNLSSCCDLCHRTSGCVGIVLTTRGGQLGLTCYPKAKMERPGGGECVSGTMGQPFPPHGRPSPPSPPAPPTPGPLPPSLAQAVQLQHHATGLCLESRTPSGNVETLQCEPQSDVSPTQLFHFHLDGTVTNGWGACLRVDNAHGIDDNVVAGNRSCDASTCTNGPPSCTKWQVNRINGSDQVGVSMVGGGGGQAGEVCLDAGSGGSSAPGADVALRPVPAAPAAPSGPAQAYCNSSAPSWGGSVLKIGALYHMWVITMRAGSGNDPNNGNPFVDSGRIDHAVSDQPTGPYKCVQENVITHTKGFVGNPQIFREVSGQNRLLLAVIGQGCAVYIAEEPTGPWRCANVTTDYNNPTLVPRPDGSVVLYCHDCAHDPIGWGDSASGVMGASATGPWTVWQPPAEGQDGDPTRLGQLFIHPMEDPFAWYDAAANVRHPSPCFHVAGPLSLVLT
jgi:hypothetical protein